MSLLTPLVAFGVRVAFDLDGDAASQLIESWLGSGKRTLPGALARANDRAWQAVGLALAGDGFLDRVKTLWAGQDVKAIRDQVRQFLEQTPAGFQGASAELRAHCLDEFQRLRKAKRLTFQELAPGEVSQQRLGNTVEVRQAAEQAVAAVAGGLAIEAPHLAEILCKPTPDGTPLLAAAFAYFFRRELEQNAELARGMTVDSLRLLSATQAQGFAHLEKDLGDQIDVVFSAMNDWFAHINAELTQLRASLEQFMARNHVVAPAAGPPTVSVHDRREQDTLRQIRDRLRQLPAGLAPADVLLRLGDGLAASGQFEQAEQEHLRAAEAARGAANRAAEAEALYRTWRDACERGNFEAALPALLRAVELDPAKFEPFPLRRYEPVRLLGRGGFGAVFLCRDLFAKKREVAIKALHEGDLARDLDEVFAEAQTLSELNHPGIIRVLHWEFADAAQKRPFLVMEYFAGVSLSDWVKQQGPLSPADLVAVAWQLAAAMEAAHDARVLHRDLKPANVLLLREGANWRVKVIDFGLAVRQASLATSQAIASHQRTVRDRSFVGSYHYASPEQKGLLADDVGPRSDIYSFGKTCLEALLRTTEPIGKNWKSLPAEWQALQEVLEMCIAHTPADRHSSFGDVRKAFEAFAVRPATGQREPERKPGSPMTLTILIPDLKRKAGELLTLHWTTVAQCNPPQR